MDARIKRRPEVRGVCCSRPSTIPSLHLFLVGCPPMAAGSLSRPADHLHAPLLLTPSLSCRSTGLCTPAQGRRAVWELKESRRRGHASGLPHLYLDTEPRSMCCACMHPSSSTQTSAFDGSQWTLARVDGWTHARSGKATGL
jgi:hypothetical protein